MSLSMHSASTPVFLKMLGNLGHWLDAAEAHAAAKKFDPSVLLNARLAPDMLPFKTQICIACDAAKNGVARLAGIEPPKFEDGETSFEQLQARIRKTLDFLATVQASQLNGREEVEVTFPAGPGKTRTMNCYAYLTTWMLPNLFFHITTAYNILRHNGVEVGKVDYLAGASA